MGLKTGIICLSMSAALSRGSVSDQMEKPEPDPVPSEDILLPFQIRRDGVWLYRGTPIRRKAMICLFASLLERDRQGRYWLHTPTESGLICVEDVPFLAVDLEFRGKCSRNQTLCFRTNVDELVCIGPDHPLICDWDQPVGDGVAPYIHVRNGEGSKPVLARVSRALMFELAALATPGHMGGKPCLGVWSQNCFFPLSRLPTKE